MAEQKLSDDSASKAAVQQATAHVVQPVRASAVTPQGGHTAARQPVPAKPIVPQKAPGSGTAFGKPFRPFKPFSTLSQPTPYFKGQKPVLVTQSGPIYLNPNQHQSHGGSGVGTIGGIIHRVAKATYQYSLKSAAVVPYGEYYVSYETARGINQVGRKAGLPGRIASHIVASAAVPHEVFGLAVDALIDKALGESVRDEGRPGHILPRLPFVGYVGPQTNLPGLHGRRSPRPHHIDFEY